ncbi:MAG: hypothetical protein CMI00_06315 [Oceanospirillaceae bacterium]|nr:hypothetical protein [Oceanospirillaceae bacterium]
MRCRCTCLRRKSGPATARFRTLPSAWEAVRLAEMLKWSGCLVLLALAGLALPAQAADWDEVRYDSDHDIRVFTRKVKGSDLKAFRAVTQVSSTLTGLVALLEDAPRAKDWVFKCREMTLVEAISPTEAIYYMITDMPWPVKNRDSISHSRVTQDAVTGTVRVDIDAADGYMGAKKGYVRIREMSGYWLFTPKENGRVEVIYEAHADPGGGLPSWLVNSFVVDAPLNTLRGLQDLIADETYQTAQRDYIKNI